MKSSSKFIIALFVLFLASLATYIFIISNENKNSEVPVSTSVEKEVTLTIINKDKKDEFKSSFDQDNTVLDLLNKLKKDGKINFEGTGTGEMFYLTSMNGYKASDANKEWWNFKVNGKSSDLGIGQYKLNPQDSLEIILDNY